MVVKQRIVQYSMLSTVYEGLWHSITLYGIM